MVTVGWALGFCFLPCSPYMPRKGAGVWKEFILACVCCSVAEHFPLPPPIRPPLTNVDFPRRMVECPLPCTCCCRSLPCTCRCNSFFEALTAPLFLVPCLSRHPPDDPMLPQRGKGKPWAVLREKQGPGLLHHVYVCGSSAAISFGFIHLTFGSVPLQVPHPLPAVPLQAPGRTTWHLERTPGLSPTRYGAYCG